MVPLFMYAAQALMLPCGGPAEARADYLQSADGFQAAVGFRGRRGTTTMRLDGMSTVLVTSLFLQNKFWMEGLGCHPTFTLTFLEALLLQYLPH